MTFTDQSDVKDCNCRLLRTCCPNVHYRTSTTPTHCLSGSTKDVVHEALLKSIVNFAFKVIPRDCCDIPPFVHDIAPPSVPREDLENVCEIAHGDVKSLSFVYVRSNICCTYRGYLIYGEFSQNAKYVWYFLGVSILCCILRK